MPRSTRFIIKSGNVQSAAASVEACKSGLLKAAGIVEEVEKELNGKDSSLTALIPSLKAIRESLENDSARVKKVADVARWSAVRYGNAENTLLGQPAAALVDIPSEQGHGGSTVTPAPSGDTPGQQKPGTKDSKITDPLGFSTKEGYTEDKGKWKGWKYKYKESKYGSADILTYEEDGKIKQKVSGGYTLKKSFEGSFGILTTTKRKAASGTTLSDWQKGINKAVNNKIGFNKFKSDDRTKDKSERVFEKDKGDKGPYDQKFDDEAKQNEFSKDYFGVKLIEASVGVSGSVLGAEWSTKGEHGEAAASLEFLRGEASASAAAGVYYTYKNGKRCIAYGAELAVGASVSVFRAHGEAATYVKASGTAAEWLGEDFEYIGTGADGTVDVLTAEATGSAKARWVDGQLEVSAEGEVGAYLAKAEGSVSGTVLGVKASAKAEVSVGIGASAKFGLSNGKLRCELGAALGIGVKISFDLDFSGAVNAIKSTAEKVWNGIKSVASTVGNAIKSAASTVGNAIKSFFSGW